MTQEEIIDGTKLIVAYIGYDHDEVEEDDDSITYYCHDHIENISGKEPWETTEYDWSSWLRLDEMKFHELWDWLMPVIEAIKVIDIDDDVEEQAYDYIANIDDAVNTQRIDLAFMEVARYIAWYYTK